MTGKKQEKKTIITNLEKAEAFFNMNGINLDDIIKAGSLNLPFLRNPYDGNGHYHSRWFENLKATPIEENGETYIKITGTYVSRDDTSYKGEWIKWITKI